MSNVVNLNDPDQTVTQVLEALLEKSRNGELTSFMATYSNAESYYKVQAGAFNMDDMFKYIGLLEVMKTELSLSLVASSDCDHDHDEE
jgi:hypothetical protein